MRFYYTCALESCPRRISPSAYKSSWCVVPASLTNWLDNDLQAQISLISGRLAIAGERLRGQPVYNHALAFRHTVDKGQRILHDFLHAERYLPRWGSNNYTLPPRFCDLIDDHHTSKDAWNSLLGAAQIDKNGNNWWEDKSYRDLDDYWSVKSADAARCWFRVMVSSFPLPR